MPNMQGEVDVWINEIQGWIIGLSGLLFLSCTSCQYKDLSPAYIHLEQFEVVSPNGQKLRHNIKELWLFIDDQYAGTFNVPSQIPVLEPGRHRIAFFPGIRDYGISTYPEIYTLMNDFGTDLELNAGTTMTIAPAFSYKSNLINYIQEGFESSSVFVSDLDSFKTHTIIRSSQNARDGSYSGLGFIDSGHPVIETASADIPMTSSAKKSAYIELDLLSDNALQIGLISGQNQDLFKIYFLTLNPSQSWKKIYIPIYQIIQNNAELSRAGALRLVLKSELKAPANTGYFFIDNVRLMCLP